MAKLCVDMQGGRESEPDRGPSRGGGLSNDEVGLLGWPFQHAAQHRRS